MNYNLKLYENNPRVSSVTGFSYPFWPRQNSSYFIRGAETWSFGIWRRSWKFFCPNGKLLKSNLAKKKLLFQFRMNGLGLYSMLEAQTHGLIDSWSVRWFTSAFINNMYCLYPHLPLCVHIGYGESSTHCKEYNPLFRDKSHLSDKIEIELRPKKVHQTLRTSISLFLMNFTPIKIK